jgi:GAF domain-containing protein
MEPIPETTEAVEEFGPFSDDDLLQTLRGQADRVREVVPECVGLSLASIEDGVTFTLVASAEEIGVLDALQYAADGPCVEAVETSEVLEFVPDPTDEERWQLFARGTAAAGVASTLSLPIVAHGRVVGGVNLYASSGRAFHGHHEELAAIFDAWAPGAITNSDLSFTSRTTAEGAPSKLRNDVRIEVAVGILAAIHDVGFEAARVQLRAAAQRAGVSEAQLAATLVELERMQNGG